MCLSGKWETNCYQVIWNDTSQWINSRLCGGRRKFAFTTFLLHLWPCANSGNSNNFHSLRRIPQMSTSSCSSSSIQFNSYWMRSSSFEIKYSLKKSPFAILCSVFSIPTRNDFTENLICRRFPIYHTLSLKLHKLTQNYVIFPVWPKAHENVFPFHSKETLCLWYVVEK